VQQTKAGMPILPLKFVAMATSLPEQLQNESTIYQALPQIYQS